MLNNKSCSVYRRGKIYTKVEKKKDKTLSKRIKLRMTFIYLFKLVFTYLMCKISRNFNKNKKIFVILFMYGFL